MRRPEFKVLCEKPGNELALARWIRTLEWPYHPEAHNFIFWYHAKHGDTLCRNNQLGIGQRRFVGWWEKLVQGDEAGAQQALDYALYWKGRNAG